MSFLHTLSKSDLDIFTEKSYISWHGRILQNQKEKTSRKSNFTEAAKGKLETTSRPCNLFWENIKNQLKIN